MFGFFRDVLFGEEIEVKINERPDSGMDMAPILRLNEAILQQAITDKATKILLRAEDEAPTWGEQEAIHETANTSEVMKEAEAQVGSPDEEDEEESDRKKKSEFWRIMAEAKVQIPPPTRPFLIVYYEIEGEIKPVMSIPGNLLGPCVRAYRYKFNWQNCVSNEKPNGLLYRKGYFLELKTFDLKAATMVIIDVTLDPDP